MARVVDANVWHGYANKFFLGKSEKFTLCCPSDALTRAGIIVFDDKDKIITEWKKVTQEHLFEEWFAANVVSGKIQIVEVKPKADAKLRNDLNNLGFPHSGDIWYLRTCLAANANNAQIILVTEDADFYDPVKKSQGKTIVQANNGPVKKMLNKKWNILVENTLSFNQNPHLC